MTSTPKKSLPTDLLQRHELLKNEFQAVRRKLDSKNDALIILTKDLAEANREKDQFKMMADQLRDRYQTLKRQLLKSAVSQMSATVSSPSGMSSQLEMDEMRQRLADAESDVKLLREKMAKHRLGTGEKVQLNRKSFDAEEREGLIEELEKSKTQYGQLEQDMKQLLDEREELVTERDTYKVKYNRLNEKLNFIMRGDEKHVVDIDAVIRENRFLQEKVKHLEEEKALAIASVNKYKRVLDKKKPTGILKATTDQMLGNLILSQQHIKRLLSTPNNAVAASPQVIQELKNLSTTLLETINDKNLALNHQRRSNKLLGSRISDLENRIQQLELGSNGFDIRSRIDGLQDLQDSEYADLTETSLENLSQTQTNDRTDQLNKEFGDVEEVLPNIEDSDEIILDDCQLVDVDIATTELPRKTVLLVEDQSQS